MNWNKKSSKTIQTEFYKERFCITIINIELPFCLYVRVRVITVSKHFNNLHTVSKHKLYIYPLHRYVNGLPETCAYMTWRSLESASEKAGNDTLLVTTQS